MGIAYHQCSGNGQCVTEGALTKRMGPGFAARGGIVAALMAEKGITGAKECLEGEVGLYNLYVRGEYNPESLAANLGKYFAGTSVGMKPYPCCKGTHESVGLAISMLEKYKLQPDDIEEIIIHCRDDDNFLVHPIEKRRHPENPVDSQFSIPWALAVVFARGRAGVQDFNEEAIASRDILDMADKISINKDPSLSSKSREMPVKIEVRTKKGQRCLEQPVTSGTEGSDNALPWDSYERKFRDCASCSIKPLPDTRIDEVINTIKQLESLEDIRELLRLLD